MHVGIAQILKAYTAMTLVDNFGDIPFSEANLGNENLSPKADNGSDVYKAALVMFRFCYWQFWENFCCNSLK